VDRELQQRLARSGYDRPGFAADYDLYRPRPPSVLLELLPRLAGADRPTVVVDLGSGTGLSTRPWAGIADEVVGIEPNAAMRVFSERVTEMANVSYLGGSSYETGLPDASVDIVTAAQSVQWMRPERLFPEVGRILRPGGVFCAYNYTVLQTPLWEAAAAFDFVQARKRELRMKLGIDREAAATPDVAWLEDSGVFRQARGLLLHSIEEGDGVRLVGFALSEGSMMTLLEAGVSEEDVGLDRLRAAADAMQEPVPWWIGYRAWLGLR
jgi:SAM-dependent methyltransferase